MNMQRKEISRMLIHRMITFPLLTPAILGYILTGNSRCLDVFYSVRSLSHSIFMRNARAHRNCDVYLKRAYGYRRTRITENNTGYKVRMKTLDTLVKELRVTPNVIKIHAEGYAMRVLDGARSTLTRSKPQLMIAAYHYPTASEEIAKCLSKLRFKCFIYQVPLALQKAKETYLYASSA